MAVQRPSVCEGFQSASSARSRSGGSAPQLSKVKVTQQAAEVSASSPISFQVSQSRTSTRRSSGESQPKSKSPPASNHGVDGLFLGKAPSQKKDGYFPPSAVEARLRATKTLLSPVLSLSGTTTPTKEFHCENPRARSSPQSVPRSTGATTRTSSLKHRPVGRVLAPPRQKYPGRFTPVKAAMPKASQRAAPNQAASGNEAEHVDVTCSEPVEFVVESAMAESRVSSPEARVGKDEHTMDEELRCSGAYHGQQSRGCEDEPEVRAAAQCHETRSQALRGNAREERHLVEDPVADAAEALAAEDAEDDEKQKQIAAYRKRGRAHTALHSQAQLAVDSVFPTWEEPTCGGPWAQCQVPAVSEARHSMCEMSLEREECVPRRLRAGTLPSSLGKDWGALSKMSAVDFKSSSTRTLTPRRVDNDSGPTTPRIEGLGFGSSVLSTRTLSPRARTASSASSPCTSPRGLHGLEARSRTLPPSAEDSVACRLSRENSAETLASMVSTRTLSPREGAMSESRGDSALGRDVGALPR